MLRLNLVLTYGIPPGLRGGVHLFVSNRHTPSGQSRVYRATYLRIGGDHCLLIESSAGAEPVVLIQDSSSKGCVETALFLK